MFDFILRPFRRRFGRDSRYYAAVDDMFGFVPHNIELYNPFKMGIDLTFSCC